MNIFTKPIKMKTLFKMKNMMSIMKFEDLGLREIV